MKKAFVYYHADCRDGVTAGFIAWSGLKRQGYEVGHAAAYHELLLTDIDPKIDGETEVYLYDICFSQDVMDELNRRALSLRCFDHHVSRKPVLDRTPGCIYMERYSGAQMATWLFPVLHPFQTLVNYIQDRDLWRFELDDSRAVNAAISTYGQTFNETQRMVTDFEELGARGFVNIGRFILQRNSQFIRRILDNTYFITVLLSHEGQSVPIRIAMANACDMQSEAGEAMTRLQDGAEPPPDFAVVYCREERGGAMKMRYSFRAPKEREGCIDMSRIAAILGGGGHVSAAGAVLEHEETPEQVVAEAVEKWFAEFSQHEANLWILKRSKGDESSPTS